MKTHIRKAGVLLHPTSFPSNHGIGDLGKEAYHFIDFLAAANQSLWQILPTGPTGFGDSPYQSFSAFAGNTLLISPDLLADQGLLLPKELTNNLSRDHVDFGHVVNYKKHLHQLAYKRFKPNKAYQAFCEANQAWLPDYCLFMAIKNHLIEERRLAGETASYLAYAKKFAKYMTAEEIDDHFYGAVWNSWPEELANRDKKALAAYQKLLKPAIDCEKFLQYQFFTQWEKLKAYANLNGVSIIGDIPIFVSIDSADVWVHKALFYLDRDNIPTVVAGVPPDYFSADGQLWGNPLYDWEQHQAEDFAWWIARMKATLKTVDIIRLDHFRGFESYWAVKYGEKTAKTGKWCKGIGADLFLALQDELVGAGRLPQLPIIAEDLGLITPEVEKLRDSLGLPGMKILQFAFGDDFKNLYLPHNYEGNNCVVYTGTHDNDTTISWYHQANDKEQDKVRRYLNINGSYINEELIRLAYASNAMWAIVPLQDILGQGGDSRMNTPGVRTGNWQYRYHDGALNEDIIKKLLYLVMMFNRGGEEPVEENDKENAGAISH